MWQQTCKTELKQHWAQIASFSSHPSTHVPLPLEMLCLTMGKTLDLMDWVTDIKNYITGNLTIHHMSYGTYGLNITGNMGHTDCIKKDMVLGDCTSQDNDCKTQHQPKFWNCLYNIVLVGRIFWGRSTWIVKHITMWRSYSGIVMKLSWPRIFELYAWGGWTQFSHALLLMQFSMHSRIAKKQTCRQQSGHFIYSTCTILSVLFFTT